MRTYAGCRADAAGMQGGSSVDIKGFRSDGGASKRLSLLYEWIDRFGTNKQFKGGNEI